MNIFEKDNEFKQNVGNFILTFSTVEFQIGSLANFIKNECKSDFIDPDIIGMNLNEKLTIIRNRINNNEGLLTKWKTLEGHLSGCNNFRRFLSHGIVSNHIPNPSITGVIKAKRKGVKGFQIKELTNEEVILYLKKVIEINSGRNGLGTIIPEIKSWLKQ